MGIDLIIGGNGFVGSNLRKIFPLAMAIGRDSNLSFDELYFRNVYCAAPQAKKWWANMHPDLDRGMVDQLLSTCRRIRYSGNFYLFSTVDVYSNPNGVSELCEPSVSAPGYGENRRYLETKLRDQLHSTLKVIRLPGLVGEGLKKNVIFDLLTLNQGVKIDLKSRFQWFNLANLPYVLSLVESIISDYSVLNVATCPVSVSDIVARWFEDVRLNFVYGEEAASYDVRSIYGSSESGYIFSYQQIMEDHLEPFVNQWRKNCLS